MILGVLRHLVDGASAARHHPVGKNLHSEELSLALQVSHQTSVQVNDGSNYLRQEHNSVVK